MLTVFRFLQRSGGIVAAAIALLGFAFYGIASLSVALVDDPSRALQILAVFIVFSAVFCAFMAWLVRKAIARARRPIDTAYEATARIASIGGKGGRSAIRFLGRGSESARGVFSSAAAAVLRAAGRTGDFLLRRKKREAGKAPGTPADVIPMRRAGGSRKAGG